MLEELLLLPKPYLMFFVTIIGAVIGSFLNVVALRGLSGESIVLPPSKCPICHNKLKWYHNIPVLSYLFLQGKCGFCKTPISIQYPIVETVTAAIFLLCFHCWGLSSTTLFCWIVSSIAIAICITDLKEWVICVDHTIALALVGIIYNCLYPTEGVWYNGLLFSIIGLIVGFAGMELQGVISKLLIKNRTFEEGDSYIFAALGALIGAKDLILVIALAIIVQVLVQLPKFLTQLFLEKKYVLCFSLITFLSLTAAYFNLIDILTVNKTFYFLFLAAVVIIGLFLTISFLKNVRNGSSLTPTPFGPALMIAGLTIFVLNLYTVPIWSLLRKFTISFLY